MKIQKMVLGIFLAIPLLMFGLTIENSPQQDKAFALIEKMTKKVGSYDKLLKKKDVVYTYSYITPEGKYDQSIEKYIFDGELSYGQYITHQRTFTDLLGTIEQGYDGSEFWLKHEGEIINSKERLKRVIFNRPTNYYWFTMMQKLLDPGLNYEYLGKTTIGNNKYEIVKISFEPQENKASDVYQLYINEETSMIDQLVFTVAEFGVIDEPYLMKLEYEKIDGLYIPTERLYKKSDWNATVTNKPWTKVNWTNISFNNGLNKEIFNKNYKMNIMKNRKDLTSLKSKLDDKKANFESKASEYKKNIYADGINAVATSDILQSAINIGDEAPNFTLKNATGISVTLKEELEKGPVVLTWYRGGWCPYCNMTLNALQDELPNFKANGASLIALSPELPDKSMTTAEKNELEFEVLSDVGNVVADSYGIVFELIEPVAESYNKSFNLVTFNGDDSNKLPLAASYIIDTDGTVVYAFLDPDYRNRSEPRELTNILKKL